MPTLCDRSQRPPSPGPALQVEVDERRRRDARALVVHSTHGERTLLWFVRLALTVSLVVVTPLGPQVTRTGPASSSSPSGPTSGGGSAPVRRVPRGTTPASSPTATPSAVRRRRCGLQPRYGACSWAEHRPRSNRERTEGGSCAVYPGPAGLEPRTAAHTDGPGTRSPRPCSYPCGGRLQRIASSEARRRC